MYAVDVHDRRRGGDRHLVVGRGRTLVADGWTPDPPVHRAIVVLDIGGSTAMTISAKARSREATYDIFEKIHIIYLAGLHDLGFPWRSPTLDLRHHG